MTTVLNEQPLFVHWLSNRLYRVYKHSIGCRCIV